MATPSSALFAGLGAGTPEPFFSCADFVGDGLDDGVAIQEAIDAAVATGPAVQSYPVVELLPGVFVADGGTSIDPKSTHIRGAGPEATSIMTLTGAQRIFDSDTGSGGSGKGGRFEDFTVINTGGTAFYFPDVLGESTYFRRMRISGAVGASGDPANGIYQPVGNLYMESCWLGYNGESLPIPTVWAGALSSIMNNVFYTSNLRLDASHDSQVQGNRFLDLELTTPVPAISLTGNGSRNLINGNTIVNVRGHGVFVDGTGGGQFDNTITNNLIQRYDRDASGLYDGIHIRDDTDANNIQGNTIRDPALGGFGINVATADCTENLVTNNDILACGFNDAGTLTAVTAGNRL